MAGVNRIAPVMPVDFYDHLQDNTKQLEVVPTDPTATFPAATIVSVNSSGNAQDYDPAIHNVAVSEEAVSDLVNVEAGPQLFVTRKSNVYLALIKGHRLVMTAGWTGSTPVILDPSHIGNQFELAIDPNSGYTFIDLTTAGSGPFTIVGVYNAPGLPEPFNTSLPTERRLNARVIVEVDPTVVFTA